MAILLLWATGNASLSLAILSIADVKTGYISAIVRSDHVREMHEQWPNSVSGTMPAGLRLDEAHGHELSAFDSSRSADIPHNLVWGCFYCWSRLEPTTTLQDLRGSFGRSQTTSV